ncbi:MAG TPA: hypothetical protein VK509_00595 [Polyangiales bacterium]|nr:hypothetical protein [Polyangiales bacterium]
MSSIARTSFSHLGRTTAVALGALAVLALTPSVRAARAETPATTKSPRAALELYRLEGADGGTLGVLAQLSQLVASGGLEGAALLEARFLRAAAATDLLVLARSRTDAALEAALARALVTDTLSAQLDAELAAAATGVYRLPAQQMRATLALLAADAKPTAELIAAAAGSQRDLWLLHAVASALGNPSDADALAALSMLGSDPCTNTCPAPFDRVAAAARRSVAAFAEAGHAVARLRAAANAGDPLAALAAGDRDALAAKLFARSLLLPPQLAEASGWTRPDGSSLATSPELLMLVGERGVRYAFAPRVRLDARGVLEMYSRGEPTWPHLAQLPFARELRPYIEPLPELVSFIQHAQHNAPMVAAVGVEPGTNAHALAHVLASWKRAGVGGELLLSAAGNREGRAQVVQLWSDADGGPEAPLGMRVRLGGYSLKQGQAPTLDIPRVRTDVGWRFDLARLDSQARSQRYPLARVSFMADVAAEDLIAAVLQLAPASDTLAIALP